MYDMTTEGKLMTEFHRATDEDRASWWWLFRLYGTDGAIKRGLIWIGGV